jgi:CubicO group peptidase (beta-lactamase class C family)
MKTITMRYEARTEPPDGQPDSGPPQSEQLAALLREVVGQTGVPGISVALSLSGQHLWASAGQTGAGTADMSGSSRFQLGCITKLLTSILTLELADERKLELDVPVAEYLPELATSQMAKRITLRHLLSHSSGYRGVDIAQPEVAYYYSWEKFLAHFRAAPLLFEPGTVFNYEHTECAVLGQILRQATNLSVAELLRARVFAPLGLSPGTIGSDLADSEACVADHAFDNETRLHRRVRTVPYGSFWSASLSDLTMTPRELVVLGEAIASTDKASPFSRSTRVALCNPVVTLPPVSGGARPEKIPMAFCSGCAQYHLNVFGHNGSARGQTVGLRYDSSRQVVVVVAMNSWQPHLRDALLNKLLNKAGVPTSYESARPAQLPGAPETLAGLYVGPQGTRISVSASGPRLSCTIRPEGSRAAMTITLLSDAGDGLSFETDPGPLTLGFFRDPASGRPCLLAGLNSFIRHDDNANT